MTDSKGAKRRLLFLLALVALLAIACDTSGPQDFLQQQDGPRAKQADNLWDITFGIAVVVFFLVEGVLVFTILKFRRKPGREAAQFHGNTKLEVILTVIPSLILAGLAVPTVRTIFDAAAEPTGALNVTVDAKQFWWEYSYPDLDLVTANELHIPVDQPIYISVESTDVIHSFWIPRLGGTQDAIPGRSNKMVIQADEPGEYWGQCKEFCGLSHANMRLRVVAHEQSDFENWVAEQREDAAEPGGSLARQGQELFMSNACAGCHTIGGTVAAGRAGPDLTHFASRHTFAGAIFDIEEGRLREWVADAPSMKPGVLMPSGTKELGLSQNEVDAIVAYLLSLE
ncbi:MAG: cytochrome c oxidase subunit II [Actinomycetota bacterium]